MSTNVHDHAEFKAHGETVNSENNRAMAKMMNLRHGAGLPISEMPDISPDATGMKKLYGHTNGKM